jgi:hypothetical protein
LEGKFKSQFLGQGAFNISISKKKLIKHIMIPPLQNINKNESKKVDIFDSKLRLNTFTFVDHFLLIFYNEWSNFKPSYTLNDCALGS